MSTIWSVVWCILAAILGALGMLGTILLGIPWFILIILIWIFQIIEWVFDRFSKYGPFFWLWVEETKPFPSLGEGPFANFWDNWVKRNFGLLWEMIKNCW